MCTLANKALLDEHDLMKPVTQAALSEDLIISVEGRDEGAAESALPQVDAPPARRRTVIERKYRLRSLTTAWSRRLRSQLGLPI